MEQSKMLEVLQKLTNESDSELLSILLQMSEAKILEYTNRTVLSSRLNSTKLSWALIAYNRLGTEGEVSRSEGGISSSFTEIPQDILDVLKNNRLAKVCGRAFEKKES